jgi:hypothetical protein
MDTVLKDLIGSEYYICIEDIVFSKSAEAYALRLENVLEVRERQSPAASRKMRIRATTGEIPTL